jgi:hypothetical protein
VLRHRLLALGAEVGDPAEDVQLRHIPGGAPVSGGGANIASGYQASVSGGGVNTASGSQSSVTGGDQNNGEQEADDPGLRSVRCSYRARQPMRAVIASKLSRSAGTVVRNLNHGEGAVRSDAIDAATGRRAHERALEPVAANEPLAAAVLSPSRFHCSARVTLGPSLV